MMNSIETTHTQASLRRHLDQLSLEDKVFIEGGHYTIYVEPLSERLVNQYRRTGRQELFLIYSREPLALVEAVVVATKLEKKNGVHKTLVRFCMEEAHEFQASVSPMAVFWINRSVSATQCETLRLALQAYTYLCNRGLQQATVGILIGDLVVKQYLTGTFKQLRENMHWLLPDVYRQELAMYQLPSKNLMLHSEARMRNQGSDKLLRKFQKKANGQGSQIYRERGCGTLVHQETEALYMAADYVLDRDDLFHTSAVVGVTKGKDEHGRTPPSCGLILAGQLYAVAREGYRHMISIYHENDDPSIRRKNLDGAMIAAYMSENIELKLLILTLLDRFKRKDKAIMLDLGQIPSPGRLAAFSELAEKVRRMQSTDLLTLQDCDPPKGCGPSQDTAQLKF